MLTRPPCGARREGLTPTLTLTLALTLTLTLTLTPHQVHVAAVAGTLLVRAMRADERELIGRRARRSAAAGANPNP